MVAFRSVFRVGVLAHTFWSLSRTAKLELMGESSLLRLLPGRPSSNHNRPQAMASLAYFCMFSSRKANTSGSQMFTPRWRKGSPQALCLDCVHLEGTLRRVSCRRVR
jgi:hypothetical protein